MFFVFLFCFDSKIQVKIQSNCPLCFFPYHDFGANSSPHDLVVTMALKKMYSIVPWIRSLRTTGCRATVVLFTDQSTLSSFSNDLREIIAACDIIVHDIGDISSLNPNQVFFSRFIILSDYLRKNNGKYNRVFLADLFDTAFQGDPFNHDFKNDTMYFIDEGFVIGKNTTNSKWIDKIKGFNSSIISHKQVLCGGMTWGGVKPFLSFIEALKSVVDMKTFYIPTIDQGLINYIVHTGIINRFVDKYTIMLPENGITTLGTKYSDFTYKDPFGSIKHKKSGNYLRAIHQYDRSQHMIKSFLESCPKGNLNITHYMRKSPI